MRDKQPNYTNELPLIAPMPKVSQRVQGLVEAFRQADGKQGATKQSCRKALREALPDASKAETIEALNIHLRHVIDPPENYTLERYLRVAEILDDIDPVAPAPKLTNSEQTNVR